MAKSSILLIDKEQATLEKLTNIFEPFSKAYVILTASSVSSALNLLKKDTFEVIVADYEINGINSVKWVEILRSLQPSARIILVADEEHEDISAKVHRLHVNWFLTKPIDAKVFIDIIEQAVHLDKTVDGASPEIELDENTNRKILDSLSRLSGETGARCVLLSNREGHILARLGDETGIDASLIPPLLGAGVSTLITAGKRFEGHPDAIDVLYREGKQECLFAVYIGQKSLLIIVVSKEVGQLGTTWDHVRLMAKKLHITLVNAGRPSPTCSQNKNRKDTLNREMDKLFGLDGQEKAANTKAAKSVPDSEKDSDHKSLSFKGASKKIKAVNKEERLSFEQAVANGLISPTQIAKLINNQAEENGEHSPTIASIDLHSK